MQDTSGYVVGLITGKKDHPYDDMTVATMAQCLSSYAILLGLKEPTYSEGDGSDDEVEGL